MEGSSQLKGNQIFAGLSFNRILFTIQFTAWLQKHVSCYKDVVCVQKDRDYFWALDAGVAYSASTEQQPKGTVAAWIVRAVERKDLLKKAFIVQW